MKPIYKNSAWAPYAKVSQQFFTDTVISTSELAVGCFGISRKDYQTGVVLTTSAMAVSLTLGFNRGHVYELFRGVATSSWINKVKTDTSFRFADVAADSPNPILVPKKIIQNEYLTAQEKVVIICLHNSSTLKLKSMKGWAAAARMHPRTLTKSIKELKKINVLKDWPGRKFPMLNEPNAWRMMDRTSHKEAYAHEWKRLGYEITTPTAPATQPAPVLSIVPMSIYSDTEDGFIQWQIA